MTPALAAAEESESVSNTLFSQVLSFIDCLVFLGSPSESELGGEDSVAGGGKGGGAAGRTAEGKTAVRVWATGQTARTFCSQVNRRILQTRPSPLPSTCCCRVFIASALSVFPPSSCVVAVGEGNTLHVKTHPVGRSELDTPALPRHV